jgi:hypothetical protein
MSIRLPDRTRLEMNMLGQRGVQVLTGGTGWLTNGGAIVDLSEEQIQAMRAGIKVQVLPLLARLAADGARVGYVGADVVGGDSVDVVQVIDPDAMVQAAFSRKSGLLVRLEQDEPAMFGGGKVHMARLYTDYRAVDGYQVPFKTERLAGGQKVLTDSVTVYEINRGVGDSTFQRPSR